MRSVRGLTSIVWACNDCSGITTYENEIQIHHSCRVSFIRRSGLRGRDHTYLLQRTSAKFICVELGSNSIYECTPGGVRSTFASRVYGPTRLAFNGAGDLFVSDSVADSMTSLLKSRRVERKAPLPPGCLALMDWPLTVQAFCLWRCRRSRTKSANLRLAERKAALPSSPHRPVSLFRAKRLTIQS